ncbi:MAG: hypothetical protein KAX49_18520 [Halanaerobiales bacterium]|nr:hypothetical protein [Halanaerobiales bacterium]
MLKYDYNTQKELREELRTYLKKMRELALLENKKDAGMLKKVIFTERRKGFLNNEYVDRLVLFLRGTGCSLSKETGGCTFCGFYNATNFGVKIQDEDYISQIKEVIGDQSIEFNKFPIVCLYNDGSMLREEEISFSTLISILKVLNQEESVKKIVIESRVEDLMEEKILQMKKAVDKELEIAVGFESANPLIRDLCINKNFENSVFENSVRLAKEHNISLIPLLMLKPPFLTEFEAIEDYIKSLCYLEKFNLKRIDMELPTVEKNTLMYELCVNQVYRPAWFWSVVNILKTRVNLDLTTPIYISPMNYSVSAEANSSNCPSCDEQFSGAFQSFNKDGDVCVFDKIECSCKKEWERLLEVECDEELPERVKMCLESLRKKFVCLVS